MPSHGFGSGSGAGSVGTPGATSSSGATNTLLGIGLLSSSPGESASPAAGAEAAPDDAIVGALGDESSSNRSLFDGGGVSDVASGGGAVVPGVGAGKSGESGGAGFMNGIGSGDAGVSRDGGSGLLEGVSSGGSGDGGGLLGGLSDTSGCFDFGCSSILLLFFVAVSAMVYMI